MALSLGTHLAQFVQRTGWTWPRPFFERPLFLRFFVWGIKHYCVKTFYPLHLDPSFCITLKICLLSIVKIQFEQKQAVFTLLATPSVYHREHLRLTIYELLIILFSQGSLYKVIIYEVSKLHSKIQSHFDLRLHAIVHNTWKLTDHKAMQYNVADITVCSWIYWRHQN